MLRSVSIEERVSVADMYKVIKVPEQLQVQIVEDDLNAAAEEGYELAVSVAAGKNGFIIMRKVTPDKSV